MKLAINSFLNIDSRQNQNTKKRKQLDRPEGKIDRDKKTTGTLLEMICRRKKSMPLKSTMKAQQAEINNQETETKREVALNMNKEKVNQNKET